MRLYLIRHGESEGNRMRLLFGRTDYPLTELGREQAAEVRDKMAENPVSVCYSSPLLRARETAEICFAHRGVEILPLPEVMEQNMGRYERMDFPTMEAEHPEVMNAVMNGWHGFLPQDGESFEQVGERAVTGLNTVLARGEDAAIVAHNGPLSAIVTHLLGVPLERFDRFYNRHGCYSAFDVDVSRPDGRVILLCFNK